MQWKWLWWHLWYRSLNVVNTMSSRKNSIYAESQICNKSVKIQIDCGATVNVLPRNLAGDAQILKTSSILRMWNKTVVKPLGEAKGSHMQSCNTTEVMLQVLHCTGQQQFRPSPRTQGEPEYGIDYGQLTSLETNCWSHWTLWSHLDLFWCVQRWTWHTSCRNLTACRSEYNITDSTSAQSSSSPEKNLNTELTNMCKKNIAHVKTPTD